MRRAHPGRKPARPTPGGGSSDVAESGAAESEAAEEVAQAGAKAGAREGAQQEAEQDATAGAGEPFPGERESPPRAVTPGLLGPTGPVGGTTPASLEQQPLAVGPESLASPHQDWAVLGYTPRRRPVAQLRLGAAPWPDRMRTLLRTPMSERPLLERGTVTEPHEVGPNVPRILDLTLRIGELLLASGESAEDVEAAMLGVSHAYGLTVASPRSPSP